MGALSYTPVTRFLPEDGFSVQPAPATFEFQLAAGRVKGCWTNKVNTLFFDPKITLK